MSLGTISVDDAVAQAPSEEKINLLDVAILFSRHRRFILAFTAIVTVLSVLIALLLPNQYTAETVVMPPDQSSSMSSALLGQLGGSSSLASLAGGSLGIKNQGDMYVSLFRIQPVEDALIHRFALMARYHNKKMFDARLAFEHHSTVVFGGKDGLLRITVTDRDPNVAAQIANAYVDEVRSLSANLAVTEASQRRAFFQQQLLEANENLASAEEAMKTMQQSTGILQIDSQARALIESAAALRGQVAEKEVELQAMRSYAAQGNAQYILAEQQLAALKAQLAQLSGKETSTSDIIVPKGNIPSAQMEYIRRTRDLRYYETVDEILAKQFEIAKLDEAREGAIIQIAQRATPPDKRSFPKPTLTAILALVLSFFIACGWALFTNSLDRLKQDPHERQRLETLRSIYQKRA